MDAKEMTAYRNKLFTDVYNNVVPDRVPVMEAFSFGFHAEHAGENFLQVLYNLNDEVLDRIFESTMTFARGDQIGLGSQKNAFGLMFSKSKVMKIAANGMIQHPEVSMMHEDEYDEFIKDPYAFMVGKARNRSYGMCDTDDKAQYLINYLRLTQAEAEQSRVMAAAASRAVDRYGLFKAPPGSGGSLPVPFDVLADTNRGFSNIVKDIKRMPEKVLEACEALEPYAMWVGNRSKPGPLSANGIPGHMAPYLNNRDFEKFYWPSFEKLIHLQAARGQKTNIFAEQNWERFLDYLQELPMGTRMYMEFGDPKKFKDKLGKKMALGGFYPISLLKTGTKEQCVDKLKELLDILMPGGNYFFRFDKSALRLGDLNIENYTAVMDYLFAHSKYENAGEKVTDMKIEDTIKHFDPVPEFKSKYFIPFEEWIADYEVPDESVLPRLKETYYRISEGVYPLLAR